MAIDYATLFNRLGKIFYSAKTINSYRGGTAADDLLTEYEDVLDQYDGASLDLQDIRGAFVGAEELAARGMDAYFDRLKTLAQQTVVIMVNADNQQPDAELGTALRELVKQMGDDSESIEAQTPTITPSYDTADGSTNDFGCVVTLTDAEGELREYVYAEDIVFRFSDDNTWTAEGEPAAASLTHEDYPAGSGASLSGTADNDGLLTNANFETWTNATTPGTWTVDVGTWNQETTTVMKGENAAKITGDGATLHKIAQAVTLEGGALYAWKVSIRLSSVPAAGELRVGLYYASDDTVIIDEASNNQEEVIDLTAESSAVWIHKSGVFRTEDPLHSFNVGDDFADVEFQIKLTTALSNTVDLFFDDGGLAEMSEIYPGGPYVYLFEGDFPWSRDDVITLAVTNAWGSEMAQYCAAYLDLREEGYKIPSDGSPTRADTLIS